MMQVWSLLVQGLERIKGLWFIFLKTDWPVCLGWEDDDASSQVLGTYCTMKPNLFCNPIYKGGVSVNFEMSKLQNILLSSSCSVNLNICCTFNQIETFISLQQIIRNLSDMSKDQIFLEII